MDTLARTIRLEALGFERPKAEGLVQMVKQSIDEEVAKKIDLRELRVDLKSDVSEVRLEIGQVRTELKQDIADLRTELKQDISEVRLEIGQVRTELKQDIADLRTELKQDISEVRLEIGQVRTELKQDIAEVKADVVELKGSVKSLNQKIETVAADLNGKIMSMGRDLHFKLGTLMIALFTALFATLVFIEPIKKWVGVDHHSVSKETSLKVSKKVPASGVSSLWII